ncbi:hypothetical protein V1264_010058 [Littorina saxatilis]|uniref:Uncharacterized protein n=1 Tax=Littorina saxatilis TaxID=31220 RepID=A0AAN9ANV8_9CAEN
MSTAFYQLGNVHTYDNSRMKEILKVQPREIRDTVIEMAYGVIEAGFVKKTPKYRGPGGPGERQMYIDVKF